MVEAAGSFNPAWQVVLAAVDGATSISMAGQETRRPYRRRRATTEERARTPALPMAQAAAAEQAARDRMEHHRPAVMVEPAQRLRYLELPSHTLVVAVVGLTQGIPADRGALGEAVVASAAAMAAPALKILAVVEGGVLEGLGLRLAALAALASSSSASRRLLRLPPARPL